MAAAKSEAEELEQHAALSDVTDLFGEPLSSSAPTTGANPSAPTRVLSGCDPSVSAATMPRGLSRKEQREWNRKTRQVGDTSSFAESGRPTGGTDMLDSFVKKLSGDENAMVEFMHQVNEVYHSKLRSPPPFMRYILIGLQSTGKSTVVERMLKFPMNIVAEGTGNPTFINPCLASTHVWLCFGSAEACIANLCAHRYALPIVCDLHSRS
jgi:hypothetical protein